MFFVPVIVIAEIPCAAEENLNVVQVCGNGGNTFTGVTSMGIYMWGTGGSANRFLPALNIGGRLLYYKQVNNKNGTAFLEDPALPVQYFPLWRQQ